jgi:hypothetical protein
VTGAYDRRIAGIGGAGGPDVGGVCCVATGAEATVATTAAAKGPTTREMCGMRPLLLRSRRASVKSL